MLQLDNVRFGFASRPGFLGPIALGVKAGQCWAIVGPNGAGKSTLLRLMAGLWAPQAGRVLLDGVSLGNLRGRERAARIAFMPQSIPLEHDYCARDVVLMGRFPYRSWGLFESSRDVEIAERSMLRTGVLRFAGRPLATLSGGEVQRVHLAAALAQEPRLLLLDEPTASLDLRHQISIFSILRETVGPGDRAAVVVTHDVNLALNYCTHALVLADGRAVTAGVPGHVLTPKVLEPVYQVALAQTRSEDQRRCWLFPVSGGAAEGAER